MTTRQLNRACHAAAQMAEIDKRVSLHTLRTGSTITINVFDEDKKAVPTKGFVAAALIVTGSERETVNLAPFGENSLQGTAKKPVAANAAISLTLKTATGKSGQVRFKR
jgi:hypothetical protein